MRKPLRQRMLAACSEIGPDDGMDPRYDGHANAPRSPGRKALQLCRQVAEALDAVFAGCGDEVLNGLYVTGVKPNPHAGRLLVTVAATPAAVPVPVARVQERLERAAGMLRSEVAAAVHRRRAPELTFVTAARPA
jgi:ribosome-binding factor A